MINNFKTRSNQLIYIANEFIPEEKLVGGNLFSKGDIDAKFIE